MLFVRYLSREGAQITHPVIGPTTAVEAAEQILRWNPSSPEVEVWEAPGPPVVVRVSPSVSDATRAVWNTQTGE